MTHALGIAHVKPQPTPAPRVPRERGRQAAGSSGMVRRRAMRTRLCLFIAAIIVVAAGAPASAAQPFGTFGGKIGGGNSGWGLVQLHGWALDDDGIAWVDVVVAPCAPPVGAGCQIGQAFVAGRAEYGRSRPGVSERYPGYPDSDAPGWAFQLDTTRYLNGQYRIWARVHTLSGETRNLQPKLFQFINNATALMPTGVTEFPHKGAEMRGNCNLADPARRWSVVSGYALDLGSTEDDTGVAWVELLLDGAIFANTDVDCANTPESGGLTNCYGLRRLDLQQFYPIAKNDPHLGFRFALDVGFLLTEGGYTPGSHRLTIRAGDHADQVANIDEFQVTFTCDEFLGNEESVGDILLPRPVRMVAGSVLLSGWALDWEGVHSVAVYIDGELHTYASFGLLVPGLDLNAIYTGYPDAVAPGWVALVDSTQFSNGPHEFEIVVTDDLGENTLIGQRRYIINNPSNQP